MSSRTSNLPSNSTRRGTAPTSLALSSSNHSSGPSNLLTTTTGGASNGPTPHSKQTISVEEWERRAPLSDLQSRSVANVMKAGEHVPLPLKVRISTIDLTGSAIDQILLLLQVQ